VAESQLQDRAHNDWLALAPLLQQPDDRSRQLVEGYVAKYGDAAVNVEGQTKDVHVAYVDEARDWLQRHAGRLTGGGAGGSLIDRHGYEMVRIEPGEFWMGSPAEEPERAGDEVRHRVVITQAFAIGATEVTQALYQAVMGDNPAHFKGGRSPVEGISWYDAVLLCNQLSEQEGLTPAYRFAGTTVSWDRAANGYRLPTEAEWEYAARAGGTQPYSGSATIDEVAWYSENAGKRTQEVRTRRANGWGLYDMSGNVWEWVWDWSGDYPTGQATDPMGPSSGSSRIRRGGSWNYTAGSARNAERDKADPGYRNSQQGFRLAWSL